MSEEGKENLEKSWIVVNSDNAELPNDPQNAGSGVEDVKLLESESNETPLDSDTDSFSIISESGCSYKTDEESAPSPVLSEKEDKDDDNNSETKIVPFPQIQPPIIAPSSVEKFFDKMMYVTSFVFIIVLAINVHKYFSNDYLVENVNVKQVSVNHLPSILHSGQGDQKIIPVNNFHSAKNPEEYVEKLTPRKNSKDHFKGNEPLVNRKHNDEDRFHAKKEHKKRVNEKYPKKTDYKKGSVNEINEDEDTESYRKKLVELKAREKYLQKKERFLIKKEHDLAKQELKINVEKEHLEMHKKYNDRNIRAKGERYKFKEEPNEKKKEKKKTKFSKDENTNKNCKHSKAPCPNIKSPNVVNGKFDKKYNLTGHWYLELQKARNDYRRREHESDWVFDRAQLRNLNRNKAYWYFQWMFDRERLRMK